MAAVAAFSYGICAAVYALAAVAAALRRPRQRHLAVLCGACLATSAWALQAALAGPQPATTAWSAWLELGRAAAWLLFPALLLGARQRVLLPGGVLLAVLAPLQLAPGAWTVMLALRLALAVLGMLLVEQLYRATPLGERWGIKFACLGLGGMFAYDFYLYSDALLFRAINPDIWSARGLVHALCAPLLAVSLARKRSWLPALAVSRQFMFHSAALLGAALYLLAMAGCAGYLRYVGGAWGPLMQLAGLCGAILVLAGTLFSGSARAWLKVWISKHFYRHHFDYREEWLRITSSLAQEGPGLGGRTIQALAGLVESPAGALWLHQDSGDFAPAASWNLPVQDGREAADSPFCQLLAQRQWVLDAQQCAVPDSLRAIPGLWLVVPLPLHEQLLGFVCLTRPRTVLALNWELIDVLRLAGRQAAGYLAYQASAEHLSQARQFESVNRMSTFVVHDLKNLVSQLSLLLQNAGRHRDNPAFQADMLDTLGHAVHKMTVLLQRLARAPQAAPAAPLRLDCLLAQLVRAQAGQQPRPRLAADLPALSVLADSASLERVLGHLLQNAVEATPADGSVSLALLRRGQEAVVELRDSGAGMSAEFIRERLFRPFDSTKPAGMGIGVFESREYIRSLGGRLEVHSQPGCGTVFRIILPLAILAAEAA